MLTPAITVEDILRAIDHVQKLAVYSHMPDAPKEQRELQDILFYSDLDWLVIMQTLIEEGLLTITKKRPPFSSFLLFLMEHNVHTYLTVLPSVSKLSRVHSRLNGATYPWNEVADSKLQFLLPRWRMLHDIFVQSLHQNCNEIPIHCISSATK